MERGYEFPEVTAWIRANKKDFELVKEMGIKETGVLSAARITIFLQDEYVEKAGDGRLFKCYSRVSGDRRPAAVPFRRIYALGYLWLCELRFVFELQKLGAEYGIPVE